MQLVSYARAQEELMRTPPSLPEFAFDSDMASATIRGSLDADRTILSEVEAKHLLAAYGIPVVRTVIAATPSGGRAACRGHHRRAWRLRHQESFPTISRTSPMSAVSAWDWSIAEEARTRRRPTCCERIEQLMPDARIKGFTVQPMIRRPRAHELILGMSVDPTFGPLMMFGAGGTAVEVLRDTAHALPPLDLNLARDMMRQTRIWRLLQGYRDRPAADLDRIAEALCG